MNRTVAVARMHLTDRVTLFCLPPAILAASFLINMLIYAVEPVDSRSSGGAAAIYIVVLIAAVMCTARGMTFALSMGSSRRAFARGTGVAGALLAAVFGVVMFLLNRLEVATGGWWLHAHFFELTWLADRNLATVWLVLTLPFLAVFLVGTTAATIWLRWETWGMLIGGVATVLVFGGAAVLITWSRAWSSVGAWFAALTPLTLSGWLAVLCVPLAAACYLALRGVEL